MENSKSLLGAAGEHYVISELLRRGWVAALAPQGAPHIDVIVSDFEGQSLFAIQVKTRSSQGSSLGGWPMGEKVEILRASNLFYCFVDFGVAASERPKTYILPSVKVAETVQTSHALWLATPGRGGKPRNPTKMRYASPKYPVGWMDGHLEAWQLLDPKRLDR